MWVLLSYFQPRQTLLQAAGAVGQTSGELLQEIGESDTDPHFQVRGLLRADWSHPATPNRLDRIRSG